MLIINWLYWLKVRCKFCLQLLARPHAPAVEHGAFDVADGPGALDNGDTRE